jgi:esterase/lipase
MKANTYFLIVPGTYIRSGLDAKAFCEAGLKTQDSECCFNVVHINNTSAQIYIFICKMILVSIILLLSGICQAQGIDLKNNPGLQKDIHFSVRINLKFSDNSSNALQVEDFDSIYYDQVILKLPKTYTETGIPTRLVYCAHGAGGGVKADSWFLNNFQLVDSMLGNGYAVFDVNGGASVENMGGSWVVQSAFKAYEYIRQNYNVYDEIFVIGLSMGGLSSTNFVYKHSNIVLAHGLFSAVLDLYEQAWKNPWYSTTRQSIAKAFNFADQSGNKWEPDKVTGWNPYTINTFCNAKDTFKIYPVPVKIWHGTGDKSVDVNYSRNFQKYIQNANGYCELRELNSSDHGLSGGSSYMNKELILFFRRFDK